MNSSARKRLKFRAKFLSVCLLFAAGILIARLYLPLDAPFLQAIDSVHTLFAQLPEAVLWLFLGFLAVLSGTWSGSNLGLFTHSKLDLKLRSMKGDRRAKAILGLREDSNLLLCTLLWSNVITNVLLTLVSDMLMPGVTGFMFSVFFITVFGEILPQAIFSRYSLTIGSAVAPIVKLARIVVWFLSAPTACVLDLTVGPEPVVWYKENEFEEYLLAAAFDPGADEIARGEAFMCYRSLRVDDERCEKEGTVIHPQSVVQIEFDQDDKPIFPQRESPQWQPFIEQVMASRKCWVILVDAKGNPRLALDAKDFGVINAYGSKEEQKSVEQFCHPLLVVKKSDRLDKVIFSWANRRSPSIANDAPHKNDVALYVPETDPEKWRVITGADLFAYITQDSAASRAELVKSHAA